MCDCYCKPTRYFIRSIVPSKFLEISQTDAERIVMEGRKNGSIKREKI